MKLEGIGSKIRCGHNVATEWHRSFNPGPVGQEERHPAGSATQRGDETQRETSNSSGVGVRNEKGFLTYMQYSDI